MKSRALIAIIAMSLSPPVLAGDDSPDKERMANVRSLGDIMVVIQLRHFKLWLAGTVGNWELAKYEFGEMKASLADVMKYRDDIPGEDLAMLAQAERDVAEAVEEKDQGAFARATAGLTGACNSCHEATGFGFIRIREPIMSPIETSPFSDQRFSQQ